MSEINIRYIARGSERVQAPDCGVPASRSDIAAGLILLLSLGVVIHPIIDACLEIVKSGPLAAGDIERI